MPLSYTGLTARVNVFAVAALLVHAQPNLLLERYAVTQPVPKNKSLTVRWRRPVPLALATTALTEGTTPGETGFTYEDVTATLAQYGAVVNVTDVITDAHEDENMKTIAMMMGQQAAQTKERILWNMMIGGTNIVYSGTATSRATVLAPIDLGDIRTAQRLLKNALAVPITKMLDASVKIATVPVAPGFIAIGHSDFEQDLRGLVGFQPREAYANTSKMIHDQEIGKIEDVRFLLSPHFTKFASAGATATSAVIRTNAANADVYPLVIFGENAFASTTLKGLDSAQVVVRNPEMGANYSDPLGQRGFVAWKIWYTAVRLNEAWIVRVETAVSTL